MRIILLANASLLTLLIVFQIHGTEPYTPASSNNNNSNNNFVNSDDNKNRKIKNGGTQNVRKWMSSPMRLKAYVDTLSSPSTFTVPSKRRHQQHENLRIKEEAGQNEESSAKEEMTQMSGMGDGIGNLEDALQLHGMPWKESIEEDAYLHYMPYFKWQLKFMKEHLSGLSVVPVQSSFEYREGAVNAKRARVFNICLKSDEYRKIRLTYYDAGKECQVFNSLWYPDASRGDLPVLGIDIMSFQNRKRNLAVIDFQPVRMAANNDPDDCNGIPMNVKRKLEFLRNIKYKALSKGKMSKRFYDENQFFSKQMLFARYGTDGIFDVCKSLYPAFQDYVRVHVDMVRSAKISDDVVEQNHVLSRHQAYDVYSADRDPAVAMFSRMFGEEWTHEYVKDFLFSMSAPS